MITSRSGLDTIDNQRLLLILSNKAELQARILLELTTRLAELKFHITKYDDPMKFVEEGINPSLSDDLGVIPFDNDEDVDNFFTVRSNETGLNARNRCLKLQRFVLASASWNVSNFVSRMIKTICTLQYRRNHFFPGHSQ